MIIGNQEYEFIDFLRLPRPHGERRKSIYSPLRFRVASAKQSGAGVNKLIFKLFMILYF